MLHLNKNPGIMKVDLGDGYFILIMDGDHRHMEMPLGAFMLDHAL